MTHIQNFCFFLKNLYFYFCEASRFSLTLRCRTTMHSTTVISVFLKCRCTVVHYGVTASDVERDFVLEAVSLHPFTALSPDHMSIFAKVCIKDKASCQLHDIDEPSDYSDVMRGCLYKRIAMDDNSLFTVHPHASPGECIRAPIAPLDDSYVYASLMQQQ